jgi:hypothetical protein
MMIGSSRMLRQLSCLLTISGTSPSAMSYRAAPLCYTDSYDSEAELSKSCDLRLLRYLGLRSKFSESFKLIIALILSLSLTDESLELVSSLSYFKCLIALLCTYLFAFFSLFLL